MYGRLPIIHKFYIGQIPVSKATTLEEEITTGDSADLTRLLQPVSKKGTENIININVMMFFLQVRVSGFDSLVEGLILDSTLPQMLTGLRCRCKVCQYDLPIL